MAAPHEMSLPGFLQHLRVLETPAGGAQQGRAVVSCELSGRVR